MGQQWQKNVNWQMEFVDVLAVNVARLLVFVLFVLPYPFASRLARLIVGIVLFVMPRLKKVGMRNLELVFPEKSLAERSKILARSFWILADNLVDFAKIPKLTRDKAELMIDFSESREVLGRIRASNKEKGILFLTLHFGSYEHLAQFKSLLDIPFVFVARGFGLRRLDEYWEARRNVFGSKTIIRKGAYAEVVDRLKKGLDVGMLVDQNVKANHAIFVDLFGLPAATTRSIGLAALRTAAPLVFGVCYKVGTERYRIFIREIVNPVDNDNLETDEKIRLILTELHKCLEEVVREHPEQWFWVHRRFKTRPEGEAETIYQHI